MLRLVRAMGSRWAVPAFVIGLLVSSAGACSSSGELEAVRTELAAMKTQAVTATPTSTSTPTPFPTPTPPPDFSLLCQRVDEFLYSLSNAFNRFDQISRARGYDLARFTQADINELERLFDLAKDVSIPPVPAGAPQNAQILRDNVVSLRYWVDILLSAVYIEDYDQVRNAIISINFVYSEIKVYYEQVCYRPGGPRF